MYQYLRCWPIHDHLRNQCVWTIDSEWIILYRCRSVRHRKRSIYFATVAERNKRAFYVMMNFVKWMGRRFITKRDRIQRAFEGGHIN